MTQTLYAVTWDASRHPVSAAIPVADSTGARAALDRDRVLGAVDVTVHPSATAAIVAAEEKNFDGRPYRIGLVAALFALMLRSLLLAPVIGA